MTDRHASERVIDFVGIRILAHIPYEEAPREKVKLPKRQKAGDYQEPDYPFS